MDNNSNPAHDTSVATDDVLSPLRSDDALDSGTNNSLSQSPSSRPASLEQAAGNNNSSLSQSSTKVPQPASPKPRRTALLKQAQSPSEKNLFEKGNRGFYTDPESGEIHDAQVIDIDDTDEMHIFCKISVLHKNGEQVNKDVHHSNLSKIHPTVNKVLSVLNLRDEAVNYLREKYPTLPLFETFLFLKLSFEAVRAFHTIHGELKEPQFKRSECEEFIILARFAKEKKNQDDDGTVKWEHFNEENFNVLREQAPKEDLSKMLKELGIDNDKVVKTLKAKSVQTPAHFVQKPKSWYSKLEVDQDIGENEQQSKQLLLNGTEKFAIEKFKQWYTLNSIGYLPSDWVVSFRNGDIHPKERDLRKVLRVIGLNADAIDALKMNDIKDIATLNRASKDWRTGSSMTNRLHGMRDRDGEQDSQSNAWQRMGLNVNDASDIINFRHWYNCYVAGKLNMEGWAAEFNSAQYNNFMLRYQPGDNFRMPFRWRWKFWQPDSLKFPQERHDYYDMLQEAAESGDVTDVQRYHLRKYYKEKREKMSLIDEITSNHYDGLGDSTEQEKRLQELLDLDEQKADEKDEEKLLFKQKFFQFYFSASLVLTLLWFWLGTTIFFMMQFMKERKSLAEGNEFEEHPGFDYVTFIHNVLFGLVSAVVIQELGEEATETSLYCRFLPTYREQRKRRKESQILNLETRSPLHRCWGTVKQRLKTIIMWVILWSTRAYIICWICLGAASLAFAAIAGMDTSNPLYITGQTWLGIAVTIGYTYFGLNGNIAPDANDKIGQGDSHTGDVQGTHDGSGGANGRDEAGHTDEREDAKKSGENIHQERIHNTIDHRNKDTAAEGSIDGIDDMTGAEESPTNETGDPAPVKIETVEMMTEEGRTSAPGYRKDGSSKRRSQQKSRYRLRENEFESADGHVPARISCEVLGADVGYESAASEFKEEPSDDEEPPAATAPAVHDPNRPALEEALHRHMGLVPRPPREPFNVDTLGVDDLLHDDKEVPGLSRGDLNDEDASHPSVGGATTVSPPLAAPPAPAPDSAPT